VLKATPLKIVFINPTFPTRLCQYQVELSSSELGVTKERSITASVVFAETLSQKAHQKA
jgi:hypothetical protein